ncbi:hypothetical protein [Streptomyces sp. NBC_00827]|uniref:hypothetical protein n=1 Tax=Streptomyces sp. NBC_00827 TaxID=2903677 RepID=UPI00386D8CC0|nr:hypothetical protein OG569_02305 [Streptomyces sp. NBC_00827]
MSAIEETSAAAVVGKDTGDGPQPSAGGSTQALAVFPHLAYGDAVHAELAGVGRCPDTLEAGLRTEKPGGRRELFLTLSWLPGHPGLDESLRPRGLALAWSHLIGWSARHGDDLVLLDVDELAAPELLGDAARHLVQHGPERAWVPPFGARWQDALELDIALVHFDEGEAIR